MQEKNYLNKIVTIPNILSLIRLCLIPVIVVQYVVLQQYMGAAIITVISGLTDILDGFIARKFNMVSAVGRILDPAADKLTQIAVATCLCFRYTIMIIPLSILVVKELVNGIIMLAVVKKTRQTINSRWHGKLATVVLYVMLVLHLFWIEIPNAVSLITIILSIITMTLSFILYTMQNYKTVKALKKQQEQEVSLTTEQSFYEDSPKSNLIMEEVSSEKEA